MKKRVLSLLLCFVLAAGLLSVCAPPAQAGTIADAFELFIKQPGQIKKLFNREVAHGDCGPAGDDVADSERRGVDPQQRPEARPALGGQHRPGQRRVRDHGEDLQHRAEDQVARAHVAEDVQRVASAGDLREDQVLDRERDGGEPGPPTQPPWQPEPPPHPAHPWIVGTRAAYAGCPVSVRRSACSFGT